MSEGSPITAFAEDLWVLDGDRLRMLGIPFDTRMTVVRLSGGGLWLHSPVAPREDRFEAVDALGEVRHVVAPNKFHHLFVGAWLERFPGALSWAGPGLSRRRKDLRFDHELGDGAEACWAGDLDQLIFAGSAVLPEVLFLHRRSRTLIVTDVIQNHDPARESWWWRLVKRANGILAPEAGAPRDWRLTVRDRAAARRSLERLLAWDFDRLVLAHGLSIPRGARASVERAFQWLSG